LNDIKKFGSVKRGYVGVNFVELNNDNASKLGVTNTTGLYVNDLVEGGGAQQAGIKKGDIITKVEGTPIYESSDLQEHVGRMQPGDKINLTVLRDGKEKTFSVTLKTDATLSNRTAAVSKSAEELFNKLGASFQPLSPAQKAKFHVNSGVVVTQVREGRVFDSFDIPVGSIITSINKSPINSVADIDKVITNLRNGNLVISGYYPDGTNFNNMFQVQ
jgi:serine protease Do